MPVRKGLLAPQNTFLDTIATRFDGTRKYMYSYFNPHFNFSKSFLSKIETYFLRSKIKIVIDFKSPTMLLLTTVC